MCPIADEANARGSIRLRRQSDSNTTSLSDSQNAKQPNPRISMLLGIQIALMEDSENAWLSIVFNQQYGMNETSVRDLHRAKQ
jgi:hypothetical protein